MTVAAVGVSSADAAPLAALCEELGEARRLALVVAPYDGGSVPGAARFTEAKAGMALEPGGLYVVARREPLIIDQARFAAPVAGKHGPTEALIRSLAKAPARAVAVLLSGESLGPLEAARELKGAGGVCLVQEPGTALFDALPRAALAAGVADAVLTPSQLGRELSRLAARVPVPDARALPEPVQGVPAVAQILALLKVRYGVELSAYKPAAVLRRIERSMARAGVEDVAEYAKVLQAEPERLAELHEELFIHVTEFFRDPESFAAAKRLVFPALLKDRPEDEPLRVWVPGCATGEEAYSLAISLCEYAQEQGWKGRVMLFATDISGQAVERARRAFFTKDQLSGVSAQRLREFFDAQDGGFKVKKPLREVCIFSRHDVTSNPPFARLDLVSCRNVLIYFSAELQKRVLPVFHYALKPGGYLWLGQSESPGTPSKLFAPADKQHKVFVKVEAPKVTPALSRFAPPPHLPSAPVQDVRVPVEFQKTADELVLFRYGPPGVVVDHELEVQQFRGRTSPYLSQPAGQPTQSLLKLAAASLVGPLRVALRAAKKQNAPVRQEGVDDEGKLAIEVTPLNPLQPPKERLYLVVFEEQAKKAAARRKAAPKRPARSAALQVEQLQAELEHSREYQQSLREQSEVAREELTSANEELQATNEELKSTNEELETAKEELQTTNEELRSLNDELTSRNVELLAAYEKLARGEDRFRMMVESVKDYAIYMLDPSGVVTSWNEGARRLKGYEAAEILNHHYSRFFTPEDIAGRLPELELETARVDGRFEAEGWRLRKDGSRFWASVVLTRMNDSTGKLIGFAKVTRDLTERRRAELELERSERRARLMISGVKDYAIFMLDPSGNVATWNEGARQLKGYTEEEIVGKYFSIFFPAEDKAAGRCERELELATRNGRAEDEGWRLRKDGSRFWANVVITRVDDPQGGILGFTKVTRDLTERKRADEALRDANEQLESRVRERTRELEQALRTRDEFLSIASHELRTPLTGLKLQLQLGRRSLQSKGGDPRWVEAFDKSLKQSMTLEDLIEDLLDVSRVQTGRLDLELTDVNVSALVDDVAQRMMPQLQLAKIPLTLELDRSLSARWDKRRMTQVLTNLVSNAVKYAPGAPLTMKASRDGALAVIEVVDQGPGIARGKQDLIFDRFERAGASPNAGGLGLGLFIARRIVEVHGGRIEVDSDLGRGARFVVRMPLTVRGDGGA